MSLADVARFTVARTAIIPGHFGPVTTVPTRMLQMFMRSFLVSRFTVLAGFRDAVFLSCRPSEEASPSQPFGIAGNR
jgi:hypothetical protein